MKYPSQFAVAKPANSQTRWLQKWEAAVGEESMGRRTKIDMLETNTASTVSALPVASLGCGERLTVTNAANPQNAQRHAAPIQ